MGCPACARMHDAGPSRAGKPSADLVSLKRFKAGGSSHERKADHAEVLRHCLTCSEEVKPASDNQRASLGMGPNSAGVTGDMSGYRG